MTISLLLTSLDSYPFNWEAGSSELGLSMITASDIFLNMDVRFSFYCSNSTFCIKITTNIAYNKYEMMEQDTMELTVRLICSSVVVEIGGRFCKNTARTCVSVKIGKETLKRVNASTLKL